MCALHHKILRFGLDGMARSGCMGVAVFISICLISHRCEDIMKRTSRNFIQTNAAAFAEQTMMELGGINFKYKDKVIVNDFSFCVDAGKAVLLSTLNPLIATIETTELVTLPGMMTGQILGGTQPIVAIKYQIAIMLCILAGRYLSVLAALWLTSFKAFDEHDVLSM